MADIDWRAIGRGGGRAVATPTLWVIVVSGVLVISLALATLPLSGAGAWVLRFVVALLAVPVVWLAVERQRVLSRFSELERTGEHPDNVVHTRTPDGQEIEVIVAGAERTVVPRLGVGSVTVLSFAAMGSGGLAFGLLLIIGIASLF